jgi:hypothetical protein
MFTEVLKVPSSLLFYDDKIPDAYNNLTINTKKEFLLQRFKECLQGISKKELIIFCIRLLNFDQHESVYHLPDQFTSFLFSFGNEFYAKMMAERLKWIAEKNNAELIYFNHTSSLSMLEYILTNINQIYTIKNKIDAEIDLLKAYTIQTEILDLEEKNIDKYIPEDDDRFSKQLLVLTFFYNDYINYDIKTVLISQTFKADIFFSFLQQDERFSKVLSVFLKRYNLESVKDYRRSILKLARMVYDKETSSDSRIKEEPIFIKAQGNSIQKSIDFLEKFSLDTEQYILQNDFISIRNAPLYKDGSGKYFIVFGLFILEKIFKNLYWNIIRLAQKGFLEIKNPKSDIGLGFSENYLTSKTLDIIFEPKDYYNICSKDIRMKLNKKSDGEPDYYARKQNTVFLFESKDTSINSLFKTDEKKKLNYQKLEIEFKKKFYENQDGDAKAIRQLICNCLKVLKKQNEFDKDYDENKVLIYPVLVVHENSFNALGFNKLIDRWFRAKLNKELFEMSVHPERIFQLTVIDIDCLIRFQEYFRKSIVSVEDMLFKYYQFCTYTPPNRIGVMQSLSSFSKFLHEYITSNFTTIFPRGYETI